jgi:hypothetical protein
MIPLWFYFWHWDRDIGRRYWEEVAMILAKLRSQVAGRIGPVWVVEFKVKGLPWLVVSQ